MSKPGLFKTDYASPLPECTSKKALGAEETGYGFCSLNTLNNSSRWAGLHAPELGPWQSCLTGLQAALSVRRWLLALGVPVSASGSYTFLGLHAGLSLLDSRLSPAHAYCGLADKRGGDKE